jgi:hypothetical protein
LIYAAGRIDPFFEQIRHILDLSDKRFTEYKAARRAFICQPPLGILLINLAIVPVGLYVVVTSEILRTDIVIIFIVMGMLLLTALLNWVGTWALVSFFQTVRQFENIVKIKINPFNTQRFHNKRVRKNKNPGRNLPLN